MELLLLLLTAHFIGDFYLQPLPWIQCRSKHHIKSIGLWKHVLVHTVLNSIVFILVDSTIYQATLALGVIAISHLLTDCWKSYQKANLAYFLVDQIIHLLIIVGVWTLLSGFTLNEITLFLTNIATVKNIIIAMAYLLVCRPASIIISIALKKHTDSLAKHSNDIGQNSTVEITETSKDKITVTINASNPLQTTNTTNNFGLNSAGAWIGYIERCLAISFVFIGQFSAIGFLVATKTIFRFGDLTKNKDMILTEYMMLGTLLSYAFALLIGWSAMQIYQAL
ncbi:hypothetical protein tinsulaeT_03450 [Thalassotalea insulae]|uniref:DUF3307 domain-containing protein n=1 Tax=Thalassotalea insulae TaxID=2056778 RepID=A0ABQ6GRG2_9GAMM|nr:DUF3307 domain-containing protein [Thalassotalea insulae]GLX77005.1 hypothetical protein tinsulaeT_03450 [Thalassotalea insulae]